MNFMISRTALDISAYATAYIAGCTRLCDVLYFFHDRSLRSNLQVCSKTQKDSSRASRLEHVVKRLEEEVERLKQQNTKLEHEITELGASDQVFRLVHEGYKL